MSKLPKRVWSGKKLVFSGKKAVREKDGQIGVYNPQFEEIDSGEVYDKKRENLDPEAPLDVYDSSKPEYIGTMEDGILATYTFYNYDRSVLKQGTCKDGETPIPPEDPTRDSDWEYDYQFAGWNPAVGPIAKDTDYVASFNETKRIYTVYVSVNDSDFGSLDIPELTVEAGTEILDSSLDPTLAPNQLKVGSTVVTATANAGYEFDYWTNWSQVITCDQYPQAVFKVVTPSVVLSNGINSFVETVDEGQGVGQVTYDFLDDDLNLQFGVTYEGLSYLDVNLKGTPVINFGYFQGDSEDESFLQTVFSIGNRYPDSEYKNTRLGFSRLFSNDRIYINGFNQELQFQDNSFKTALEDYLANPKDSDVKNNLLSIANNFSTPIQSLTGNDFINLAYTYVEDTYGDNMVSFISINPDNLSQFPNWLISLDHYDGTVIVSGDWGSTEKGLVKSILESYFDNNSKQFSFIDYTDIDYSMNKCIVNPDFKNVLVNTLAGNDDGTQLRDYLNNAISDKSLCFDSRLARSTM